MVLGQFILFFLISCRKFKEARQRNRFWIKVVHWKKIFLISLQNITCTQVDVSGFCLVLNLRSAEGLSNPPKIRRNVSASANISNLASQSVAANPGFLDFFGLPQNNMSNSSALSWVCLGFQWTCPFQLL